MEHHQMLLLFACLLLLVNLGLNIAVLVKKKKTSEDYTALVPKSQKLSIPLTNSNTINYKAVATFTQTPGMANEVLRFNLAPNVINPNYRAYVKFEGLEVPIALVIEQFRLYVVNTNTGDIFSRDIYNTPNTPVLSSSTSNNFTLTYKNVAGNVTLELTRVNTRGLYTFNYTLFNNLGKQLMEYNAKTVTVSFASNYISSWTLL